MELGLRGARGEIEILAAAFGVEARGHGDGFHQGGLAGAVFADQKRHAWIQHERLLQRRHRGQREWIPVERRDALGHELHARDETESSVWDHGYLLRRTPIREPHDVR